jgi:hypothetical protein
MSVRNQEKRAEQPWFAVRRRWRRTFGEYLLRAAGLVLAVVVVVIAWRYADTRPQPGMSSECSPAAPSPTSRVLLEVADRTGLRGAQAQALKEAVESYFGVRVDVAGVGDDDAALLRQASAAVVFGNAPFEDNKRLRALVDQAVAGALPLVWIGQGIDGVADRLGLVTAGDAGAMPAPPGTVLDYRGVSIPVDGMLVPKAVPQVDADVTQVVARLSFANGSSRPAAIVRPGLVYVGLIPFWDLNPTLALPAAISAMSALLGEHARDPRVLFRLEDLNGRDYGEKDQSFKATADYLLSQDVFMHLSIIPICRDAEGAFVADIGDATPILDFVARHPRSVEIVQHGGCHFRIDPRNKGRGSGDAFEFFFDDDLMMGPAAAQELARSQTLEGREVLERYGLHAGIYEAPHYTLSLSEQAAISELFPVMHHPPLFHSKIRSQLLLPWFTWRAGTAFAPSAIGYVEATDPSSVDRMLEMLRKLARVLPDPVVVIHYHSFMTLKENREGDLAALIGGAKRLGYRFASTCEELSKGG